MFEVDLEFGDHQTRVLAFAQLHVSLETLQHVRIFSLRQSALSCGCSHQRRDRNQWHRRGEGGGVPRAGVDHLVPHLHVDAVLSEADDEHVRPHVRA